MVFVSGRQVLIILVLATLAGSCKPLYNKEYTRPGFADQKASRQVKKLHKKLYYLSKQGFGVGHQDDMAYGIGWKHGEDPNSIQSDLKSITNDLPAVFGFDVGGIENGDLDNLDHVPFDLMRELMVNAHKQGGIVTVSWHVDHPVTGGDSWDKTSAVSAILNEKEASLKFEKWIERFATFIKSVKYRGKAVPIIFRPWHEMNGDWFWWGDPNCTSEDYVALWKKTVLLLRDFHKVHNLLYAYSPNTLKKKDNYLTYYPGDEFVDVLGVDVYDFENMNGYDSIVDENLKILDSIAVEKNKLYAFTETGLEKTSKEGWFNESLYPVIEKYDIAWILFWRNHNTSHHYIPYAGHKAASDFKLFTERSKSFLLKDLENIKY